MWVNNETGIIQPVEEIAAICKEHGLIFHTDASQALGKVDINIKDIDAMSFTSHKIYGPQGIGALYVKNGLCVKRAGTLPTALCVGFGEACELLKQTHIPHAYYRQSHQALKNYGVVFNGDPAHRVPDIFNVRFMQKIPHVFIQKVAISQGSACLKEWSYVLKEMGLNEDEIAHSFRISLSRFITQREIKELVDSLE